MVDKLHLRSLLRQLRAVSYDKNNYANVAMAPQEILDFLAMYAGVKPVYLLGRGFDDPSWMAGVRDIAQKKRLHVVYGEPWDAAPSEPDLPEWYSKMRHKEEDPSLIYICKGPGQARELQSIAASKSISIDVEARLLGYPVCCVKDHYDRAALMDRTFWQALNRVARNNELEVRRLIQDDVPLETNAQEQALIQEATLFMPAPYTSIQMCPRCAERNDSPAMRLSRKYRELAIQVDPALAAEVEHYSLEHTDR